MPLTAKEVENALPQSKPSKLHDERGLYLEVSPKGSKRWHLRYSFQGRKKKISFGPFPEVSLKEARAKRDATRTLVAQGVDPLKQRRDAKIQAKLAAKDTFTEIAHEFIAKRANDGDKAISVSTQEKNKWLLSLLEPKLGRVPVREITAPLLLSVLSELQETGRRETARRCRSLVGRVLDHAIVTGRAEHNPATALQRALPAPTVRHHPAIIDPGKLVELFRAIDGYKGQASTKAALQLSAHLFQRPGEIRTMRWDDVDLENAVWTIPAAQTKMRRDHKVPLSRQAIAIIRSIEDVAAYSEYVFPSFNPKRPLSENAVTGALKRLGYAGVMTAHGFRTTASSLLNESGEFHPDAIERALAHQDNNAVRAAYNRTQYWDERVRMMQWWSNKIDSLKLLNSE